MRSRDLEDLPRRGKERRPPRRALNRQSARDILRRADWLDRPLIYWTGEPEERPRAELLQWRAARPLLEARLAGQPPGLYAPALSLEGVNPTISELGPVNERLIAVTTKGLLEARKHNPELASQVGDVAAWRAAIEARLSAVAAALRGAADLEAPAALALEGACWWLGPRRSRPSRRLSAGALRLRRDRAQSGHVAAAVALGRRGVRQGSLAALGRALSCWPLNLLTRVAADRDLLRASLAQVRAAPGLDAPEWAEVAWEFGLALPPGEALELPALLAALAGLLEIDASIAREPERREVALMEVIYQAAGAEEHRTPGLHPAHELSRLLDDMGAVVRAGFKRSAGEALPESTGLGPAVEALSARLLGAAVYVSKGDLYTALRGGAGSAGEALVDHLHAELDALDRGEVRPWRALGLGAAGRLAGAAARPALLGEVARWLDAARLAVPPLAGGGAHELSARALVAVAELCGDAAAADRAADRAAERGVERLAELSGPLLDYGRAALVGAGPGVWRRGPVAVYERLKNTAFTLESVVTSALPEDALRAAIDRGLLTSLYAINRRPAHVGALLLEDTAALGVPAEALRTQLGHWGALYSDELAPARGALRAWMLRCREALGLDWEQISELLSEVIDFATSDPEGATPARAAFLSEQAALLEAITAAVADFVALGAPERDGWSDAAEALGDAADLIDLAWRWRRAGRAPLPLGRALLEDWLADCRRALEAGEPSPEAVPGWRQPWTVAAALAPDHPAMRRLLKHLSDLERGRELRESWEVLRQHPELHGPLGEVIVVEHLRPRLVALLGLVPLLARLPEERHLESLKLPLLDPPALALPGWLRPEEEAALRALAWLQAEAGRPLPRRIRKALSREQDLAREHAALTARTALSDGAKLRVAKLEGWLADPRELRDWSRRELAEALAELRPQALLDAMDARLRGALRRHWLRRLRLGEAAGEPLEDAHWWNALRLMGSTDRNRRLLRQLLRRRAAGRYDWLDHPGNQAFLDRERAAGRRPEGWLAPLSLEVAVPDGVLRAVAETDPLKVLQMGNYFGTCLSVGGINEHSTIANAIEANKRVFYLLDGAERVLARQLVVLSRAGAVVGFRVYGAGSSDSEGDAGPWPQILFGRMTRALREGCGGRWPNAEEDARYYHADGSEELALFADWYNDGSVPCSWWLPLLDREGGRAAALARLEDDPEYSLSPMHLEASLQLVIDSGAAALPALETIAGHLSAGRLGFIARWADDAALRARAAALAEEE